MTAAISSRSPDSAGGETGQTEIDRFRLKLVGDIGTALAAASVLVRDQCGLFTFVLPDEHVMFLTDESS